MISNKQSSDTEFQNEGHRKTDNEEIKTLLFHNQ